MDKLREKINERNLAIICIVIIAITIIIVINLLYLIWKPKSENTDNKFIKEDELTSEYKFTNYKSQDVVEKYFTEIVTILGNGNIHEIYEYISKEFLDEKKYDKEQLYNYLKNKSLIENLLSATQYKYIEHYNLGRIYEITVVSTTNVENKILLIEESPNNYKLSFDNFINEANPNNSATKNGLKVTVNNIKEYTSKMYITLTLENVGTEEIIINDKNRIEDVYITFLKNQNLSVPNSNSWLNGKEKILRPSEKVTQKLIYTLTDLSSSVLESIVIKDVYNKATEEISDLEFNLFE